MADNTVTRNLRSMDELDFKGWNGADWHGLFAQYHTDDVLVDVHGQQPTHGVEDHIDAMKALVEKAAARRPRSRPIQLVSDTASGRAWWENLSAAAGW